MNMERKVTEIHHYLRLRKTRIAVYCRVSTSHEDQLKSLKNQISQYQDLVSRHFEWELIDIYSDIRSGKNTSDRPEFQRMLEDCRNHKIDLIITKSISRFGRNTVETLDALNKLRSLQVDVYFENEKINTMETNKDFLIYIIQAVAQAESESRSANIKWGMARGLESGKSKLYDRKCFGYAHDKNGELVVNEVEAEIVRKIFQLYINGYSILGIIRELENQQIKSPTGKDRWNKRTVEMLLCNEKYTGNVLIGKSFCNDFLNNNPQTNKGERVQYYAE